MKTTPLHLINTLLLLTCFPLQAQEYLNGDTLYVWAKSGLNLRSAPSIEAAVIQTIPYGQPVEVITRGDILDKQYRVKIIDAVKFNDEMQPDYTLQGYWAEVNYAGKTGYVFDGFLSRYKPFKKVDERPYVIFFNFEEYGVLQVLEERGKDNPDYSFRRVVYNDGVIEEYGLSIGGGGSKYIIPGGRLKDGLLMFMIASKFEQYYKDHSEGSRPRLISKSEDMMLFHFGDSGNGKCKIQEIEGILMITVTDEC